MIDGKSSFQSNLKFLAKRYLNKEESCYTIYMLEVTLNYSKYNF